MYLTLLFFRPFTFNSVDNSIVMSGANNSNWCSNCKVFRGTDEEQIRQKKEALPSAQHQEKAGQEKAGQVVR
jgi:hypothetical protein